MHAGAPCDYQVVLDAFRGPLDLLLYLVKREEVDILDIPIARVADQFKKYLDVLQLIDVERAGVWTLPTSAVRQKDGEVWCFVNDNGTARRRRLLIGLEGGGLVEVYMSEVKGEWAEPSGSETVVGSPAPALKDGDALN